jgi:hypothetical protein
MKISKPVIPLALFFAGCSSKINTLSLHREIRYTQSKLIKRLVWESEPLKYSGTGTDMHRWTWGIDSSVYSIDDDGANFGGLSNSYGLDEKRIAIS